MKTFKQYITEGKYDELKKELMNSESIQEGLNFIKQSVGRTLEGVRTADYIHYEFKFHYKNAVTFGGRMDIIMVLNKNSIEMWDKDEERRISVDQGIKLFYDNAEVIDVIIPEDVVRNKITIKLDNTKAAENPYFPILTMKFPYLGNRFYKY